MRPNYKPFINRMIQKYEGGYGWDKADPGGPTKYGITCHDLAEYRGQKMLSMTQWAPIVKAMPLSDAEEIYRRKYARAVKFDDLPSGLDVVILDYAVNSGIGRAPRVLRAVLGMRQEGGVTSDVLLHLASRKDIGKLIDAMCDERLGFMKRIRGGSAWKVFGRGWQRRVDDLRAYAKNLAGFGPATGTVAVPKTPKATNKPKAVPTGSVPAGLAASGGLLGLMQAHPVYAALAVVILVAAGILWYKWRNARAAKQDAAVVLPGA